jgi:hypothetical protein
MGNMAPILTVSAAALEKGKRTPTSAKPTHAQTLLPLLMMLPPVLLDAFSRLPELIWKQKE